PGPARPPPPPRDRGPPRRLVRAPRRRADRRAHPRGPRATRPRPRPNRAPEPAMTPEQLADLVARITDPGADPDRVAAARAAAERWATRAKPPGSLGRLEDVAVRLAGITGACPPAVPGAPAVLVFAADHGVVADGASAWPSEITGFM